MTSLIYSLPKQKGKQAKQSMASLYINDKYTRKDTKGKKCIYNQKVYTQEQTHTWTWKNATMAILRYKKKKN